MFCLFKHFISKYFFSTFSSDEIKNQQYECQRGTKAYVKHMICQRIFCVSKVFNRIYTQKNPFFYCLKRIYYLIPLPLHTIFYPSTDVDYALLDAKI